MTDPATATVRNQYEALPYPPRDPEGERRELLRTWLDDLPMIAHYGFGGAQLFDRGFRVLVAGGGTGDATVFLAEQLRHTNAEIVHLDLSSASIAIAQARAEARGLKNIRWVRDSLLELPRLGLGAFDYVNCAGVLHHLEDPDAGLKALLGVLAEDGVLGLMVYARYGRTGVYQMQSLMGLVNEGADDPAERIARTKAMLAALPRGNWFKRGEDLYSDHRTSDAGLYDLLLHSRDRAYSVGELYDWIEGANGLHLTLTDVQRGRAAYLPHLLMGPKPPALLHAIRLLPLRRQYEIGELYTGSVQTHSFFASRRANRVARYGDPALVPFFYHEPVTGPDIARLFKSHQGRPFVLDHAHTGVAVTVTQGRWRRSVLEHIDGRRSWAEVFERVRAEPALKAAAPTDDALFEDFREIYELLNAIERLLSRAFPTMNGKSPDMEANRDARVKAEIDHDIVAHIFTISAAMVGVCLTAIGLIRIVIAQKGIATIADDVLAFDAFLFVTCCFGAFWSFKTRLMRRRGWLETYVEGAFLFGLSLLVVACALIVYGIA